MMVINEWTVSTPAVHYFKKAVELFDELKALVTGLTTQHLCS